MMAYDDSELAEELLRRTTPPVYDEVAKQMIAGKTILVTGAGGSIGSEIVRQLRKIDPRGKAYYIDNSEYNLYTLQMSLTGRPLLTEPEYILADIRNRAQIQRIFSKIKPDIVFHAAAYKQLPLLEKSPENAIKTNVIGTDIIAEACINNDVGYLINISTDKAANPTSILGMTKRLTEMIVSSYANDVTRTASVRFGNVLGSKGSFVETMKIQVANGSPITITDPRMSRYFMTIPEAAGLVIEALTLANHGSTYVLDMGEPIKIVDLLDRYVKLMNINDPKIIFTGARQGEKLVEELFDPSEEYRSTAHPKIREVDVPISCISKSDLAYLSRSIEQENSSAELKLILEELINNQHGDRRDTSEKIVIEMPLA